jgi:hypothetical protein
MLIKLINHILSRIGLYSNRKGSGYVPLLYGLRINPRENKTIHPRYRLTGKRFSVNNTYFEDMKVLIDNGYHVEEVFLDE